MTLNLETDTQFLQSSDVQVRLSVDLVLFTLVDDRLHVLLRRRSWPPFLGMWSLPGAINPSCEQLKDTMLHALSSMDLSAIWLEQLKTFDRPPQYVDGELARPGRDPRGRVISVAYFGLVPINSVDAVSDQDSWKPIDTLPELAFDHAEIVRYALTRLRNKILYSSVAFQLLPETFTLTQLQRAYEMVLGEDLDKRNFRRKVLDAGVVIETGAQTRVGTRRPARLYRFADREFELR